MSAETIWAAEKETTLTTRLILLDSSGAEIERGQGYDDDFPLFRFSRSDSNSNIFIRADLNLDSESISLPVITLKFLSTVIPYKYVDLKEIRYTDNGVKKTATKLEGLTFTLSEDKTKNRIEFVYQLTE